MYRAIREFADLKDELYEYKIGDIFPRDGFEVSEERIEELLSDKNAQHTAVIELVEAEKPKAKRSTKKDSKK